jgi:hypothetical protein
MVASAVVGVKPHFGSGPALLDRLRRLAYPNA